MGTITHKTHRTFIDLTLSTLHTFKSPGCIIPLQSSLYEVSRFGPICSTEVLYSLTPVVTPVPVDEPRSELERRTTYYLLREYCPIKDTYISKS